MIDERSYIFFTYTILSSDLGEGPQPDRLMSEATKEVGIML